MVVSTAQDILFLHSEQDDTSLKTFSDEILALNSDGGSNVFILQNGGQNQLKISNISAPNFYQQSSHYFPIKIPAVDQVLPFKNGNCFISNQTYLSKFGPIKVEYCHHATKVFRRLHVTICLAIY